ncbi:MAG: chromate reductase [Ascidiaceihabitans sp.]|jgi:chromate reductase
MNRKLLRQSALLYTGATYVEADLRMSLYDGDEEDAQGQPEEARALFDAITNADAVLISTPEYNSGISGVMKNALDWVSRLDGNPWLGKPVVLMSAAAGRSGGARAQFALRLALAPFRPMILTGPEVAVAHAAREFDENDNLVNEFNLKALTEQMSDLRKHLAGG